MKVSGATRSSATFLHFEGLAATGTINPMYKIKKLTVRRTKRIDAIIHVRATYEGDPHADPRAYNRIFADVLRHMADAISKVTDAWVDPEVVVWMHRPGEITAEVPLSAPPTKRKRTSRKK